MKQLFSIVLVIVLAISFQSCNRKKLQEVVEVLFNPNIAKFILIPDFITKTTPEGCNDYKSKE